MGVALYRKYRSKKLSEIVGQDHITTVLSNALKNGKISHAYLFTGPKGVGKTSIARILAHEVNNLPYDKDATHLDIIEIDAASNRRIDEIRELRERVHNAPASAKYKIYIIDEVHMLTREAFNALLKTLEEPPEHAIFILATTEAHKLPETIVSRTQRYSFKPIDSSEAIKHLKGIAKQEKIEITDDAIALIAEHGDGSFRDSISLLDQISNHQGAITLETVQQHLGVAPAEAITKLVEALSNGQATEVTQALKEMQDRGYQSTQIAKQLGERLRAQLLEGQSVLPTSLIRELLAVPAAHDPDRLLEIILLEASLAAAPTTPKAEVRSPKSEEHKNIEEKPKHKKQDSEFKLPEAPKPESNAKMPKGPLNKDTWELVLQAIKARHNTIYSVARMAAPSFKDDSLVLAFSFPFHQKRLSEDKNRQIISDIIKETTGRTVTITCVVEKNVAPPATRPEAAPKSGHLTTISNIFGGGEMLE